MVDPYVFVIQHVHEMEDEQEDVKFIGVYSTEESAKTAIARLSTQPGFRETANGFYIDRYKLDEDHWTEGFVTI